MDDDYDKYVPQISTMDWQQLGGAGGQDGGGVGPGGSAPGAPSSSSSFLYDNSGQMMAGGGGQFQQQQRSFPGMGIGGTAAQGFPGAEYGAGGGGGPQAYQTGGFIPGPAGMQSQMAAAQQQQQMQQQHRQMMAAAQQQQYGTGPGVPYSTMPPPSTGGKASASSQPAGTSTKAKSSSKKSKKAQAAEAAAAAAAAAQQQNVVDQQQQGQQMATAGPAGTQQPQQQYPMPGQMLGGFYYKGAAGAPGPSVVHQQPPQMMSPTSGGGQQMTAQAAGKWPQQPGYQQVQQQQEEQQRQQVQQQFGQMAGAAQQPQAVQQPQQHYGPLQHLQQQYGGPPQTAQQLQYQAYAQQQSAQPQAAKAAQEQQPKTAQGQPPPGQYGMAPQQQQQQAAAAAAYYGQQQYGHAGPAAAAAAAQQQYMMGMPPQQQAQQAAAAGYPMAASAGYPPAGYTAAMQKQQAYYAAAQQQQMAMAQGPGGVQTAGAVPGAAGMMAYYQQQQQAPPYGPGPTMVMPNPYVVQQQQQQCYREMYECDQQLGQAMGQAQQQQQQPSPELAMRIEKLQMHRQYLHGQMIQLQQAAHAAAAAAAAAGAPPPMGMAQGVQGVPARVDQQQQQPQSAPPGVPYQQQQQYQPQMVAVAQPGGQQGASSKMPQSSVQAAPPPPPYVSSVPPPQQYPPPAGFHSPGAPQSVPTPQHQPPTPQQVVQQQQPQQQMQPQYAPHMSSPSVAVMSASSQVQVNIRPELPGRTMISVYHSPDVPTSGIQPAAVVSSAAMPYQMQAGSVQMAPQQLQQQHQAEAAGMAAVKDSIPPEPLPPNLAQEQKRRQKQQQKMLEQQQEQQAKMQQQIEQQQQQQQQSPQVQAVQHAEQTQLQQPEQQQKPKSPPPRPKTPPPASATIHLNFFGPGRLNTTSNCSRTFALAREDAVEFSVKEFVPEPEPVVEEVQQKVEEEPMALEESQEAEEKPDDQQQLVLTEGEEDEHEQPSEITEMLIHREEQQRLQKQASGEKGEAKEKLAGEKLEEKLEAEKADVEMEEEEKPEHGEEEEEKQHVEAVPAIVIGAMEPGTSSAGLEIEMMTPSNSDLQLECKGGDDKESTADESQWPGTSTKETTPQDAEDFPFSFRATKGSTSRKSSAPGGTKSGKLRSRKRKMDWNRDEDDDYVGRRRRKKGAASGSGGRKEKKLAEEEEEEEMLAMEMAVVEPSDFLDDDLLVEKRRSARKSAGGKRTKYGEDSENDEELGKPLTPKNEEGDELAEQLEERVVEKILGVRIAKRMVRKGRKKVEMEGGKDGKKKKKAEGGKTEKAEENRSITEEEEKKEKAEKASERPEKAGGSQSIIEKEVKKEKTGEERAEKAEKNQSITGEAEKKEGKTGEAEKEKTAEQAEKEVKGKEEKEKQEEESEKTEETEEKSEKKPAEDATKESKATEEPKAQEDVEMKASVEEGDDSESPKAEDVDVDATEEEVEELYVKFKGYSYLHCEWKTLEELEQLGDKRVPAKLNRWKQKFGDTITVAGEEDEQEYFNEDYTVVARVLDETYDELEQQHYIFVKWKALPYEDCTWENIQDVPEQKLAEFRRRIEFDQCKVKEQNRLSPKEWSSRLAIVKERLYKNDNVLREYQHEGVNWLLWTWTNSRNCILADEMGLGKTVQTIVFFQSLYDVGIHGPFLVVVPLSTLGNWEREFDNWTDINAIVYHGGANSRRIIQEYEFFYKRPDAKKRNITKFDALITTYEVVVQEVEVLKRINFRVCVIDEAHRIKNRNCKLLQTGLLSLKMEHRVLLTGTPLQNNIQELFSLLNFLEPEQFANSEAFLQQFGQCQTEEQVQKLQEILKPMMLRRLKEDVEKELQPKEETIIEVQLSNIQKKYYRAVLERNFTHLMKGTTPSLINTMMQLRKCCNHPYLINGAEEQILAELKVSHPELATVAEEQQLHVLGLISSSGKLVLIDKLLPKLHTDGHKVLIFSQMVRVLDLLEEYLNIKNYPFERIDGNIRGNERQAAIDRFSKPENKDRFVFLLCTRAGGLGINLTAADTVIIFDSDWNPQNDLQAQARCHRIGQTKPVKIYRLITSNTYEREMFDKASLKLGLDKAVLQSMLHRADAHGGGSIQQMSRQEVEDLLRKGAYGAIMDENEEGAKFSEEDIDTILQRRTQTIRLEPGVKGSTFAKASFTTTHNRDDIDIGDPDFWSKWARKANIDMDALNNGPDGTGSAHLIVHEPRARKKRFEADNFNKGNSESGDEGQTEDDDRNSSTPGTSRIVEGVKSRSARKKRRTAAGTNAGGGEEDDDYAYKPDELAFSKSVYFKVEKLLTQWGWGRWATMKQTSDLGEHDLEHISRTLLLHCIREFRGDEKVQDYVWSLISPLNPPPASSIAKANGTVEKLKTGSKAASNTDSKSKFHQGWAALPEYNPPFICVDMTFQRHLHRHSNKLLNRVLHLHFLHTQIEELQQGEGEEQERLKAELLPATEALDGWLIMPQWDRECDRDLLLGVHKHGMENWEQIRTDPSLCFTSKTINFPNTLDLNNRFKYLVALLQRRTEAAPNVASTSTASTAPTLGSSSSKLVMIEMSKWTKVEESDFMRILRNYGVKDDTNSENVINWARFREISIVLKHKSDAEMLEMLYCVLAMCTKQQGGMLSPVDERRADRVEAIAAKSAEKLMNRLHLMRKVHAIITMGIQNIRGMLKMVALDVMPKGWSEAHDEHLLIVVDKFGLEDIHGKLKHLPKLFDAIHPLDEHILLRRVVEICATLENGKWTGTASTDNLEDSTTTGSAEGQQPGTSGSSSTSVIATTGRSGAGKGQASGGASAGGNGRRKGDQSKQQKMADKNAGNTSIATASGGTKAGTSSAGAKTATATMSYNEQQILLKMMEQMSNPQYLLQLMSMMGPSSSSTTGTSSTVSSSSNSMAALQQQFQQLQTLLTLTALSGSGSSDLNTLSASLAAMSGTSTSSSSGILPKASSASTDVLNLSKKSASTDTKAASSTPTSALSTSFGTPKSGTTSSIMSSAISAAAVKPAFTSADACLSTGLSSSAINKLSAMSVPELLAYSNLGQETRIPVIHADTQQKLEGDKAPTLKSLDQFLRSNQKYSVDLLSLATSHPSLFSGPGNPVMSMGSAMAKTPSTPTITQQKKQQAAQTPSSGHINSSGTTTPTQQQQPVKKSGLTATSMLMGGNKSGGGGSSTAAMSAGNTLSSSLSSLFGMDLGGGSTTNSSSSAAAANSAALNQFLAGLSSSSTPSQSQQLSNQLQSALNSSNSSSSLKQMEQQLLLLQQAAMLGGTGSGGTSATASFNPYTALLYQNPGELFGLKTTTSSASSTAASMQSALLAGGSSTNPLAALNDQSTMAAAAAALAQAAAAFPSGGSGSAAATADLTSALTSELYMAAMASTLPSLLGGSGSGGAGGGGGQGTTAQNNATALQQQQQAASSNASLYANVNAATLEQLLAAAGLSAGAASGLLGTTSNASSMKPAGTIKVEPGKSAQMPSSSTGPAFPLQQAQRSAESPSSSSSTTMAKKGQGSTLANAAGCKGLKLNALLEKLASAGVANASTTSGQSAAASSATMALASAEEECGVAQGGEERGNVPQTAKEEEEEKPRRRAEEAAESGRGEEGDGEKKPKEEE